MLLPALSDQEPYWNRPAAFFWGEGTFSPHFRRVCKIGFAEALVGNRLLFANRCIRCTDKLIKATLFFPRLIPEGLQNSSPVKGATIFTWLHHLSWCAALSFINLFTKRRIAEFVCERRGFGRASGGSDFPAGQMAVLCGQRVCVCMCV